MAIYCAKGDESYDIGAEGKTKMNEARGNFFTLMSCFGAILFVQSASCGIDLLCNPVQMNV